MPDQALRDMGRRFIDVWEAAEAERPMFRTRTRKWRRWIILSLALAMMLIAASARACTVSNVTPPYSPPYSPPGPPPPFFDIAGYADAIVVGRITNYAVVRGPMIYRRIARDSAGQSSAGLTRERGPFEASYARFDIVVDEVLVGKPTKVIPVIWINSTFGVPDVMASGPFVVALRAAESFKPSLAGGSYVSSHEPDAMTVLQANCSAAYFFESASEQAAAVRAALARKGDSSP